VGVDRRAGWTVLQVQRHENTRTAGDGCGAVPAITARHRETGMFRSRDRKNEGHLFASKERIHAINKKFLMVLVTITMPGCDMV
jgi:hypothetical protein